MGGKQWDYNRSGITDGDRECYREALFLVYFEGLSHAETAAVMGKREKQVADLIYRGKIALRKRLEQEGITDAYNG